MMLDRDRHADHMRQIREAGARLQLIMDGDVAAALLAAWEERNVDLLIGIGGTPEGVTAACAVQALGGEILGRIWPRNDQEKQAAIDAGYDLDRVLRTEDLVSGQDTFFAVTGVTPGQLVEGVSFDGRGAITESLVMRGKSGTIRVIRARHQFDKLREFAVVDY